MTSVQYHSRFHGVGQGLFYSLRVNNQVIVYDCGVDTKKEQLLIEINSGIFSDKVIHLFIISHFHNDHINGIRELHKIGVLINEFVMPYYFKEIRWLFIEKDGENREFITDPVKYLHDMYPKCKITFISDNISDSDAIGDDDIENQYERTGWVGQLERNEEYEGNSSVNTYSSSSVFRIPFWKFKFLQDSFPSKIDIVALRKAISDSGIDVNNDTERIQEVIEIMKAHMTSRIRNETSLICCHGPVLSKKHCCVHIEAIIHSKASVRSISHQHYHSDCFTDSMNPAIGILIPLYHLLSGDAQIEDQSKYEHTFLNELNLVQIFQIPHHGSKENWHNWFLKAHANANIWLFSRGIENNHGHPSADFSAINRRRMLVDLTETDFLDIEGEINTDG